VAGFRDGKPGNQQEVYAREQIELDASPVRELKLQAVRIGELGITAIPNEVFAITGLKLKAMSPLGATFNISLANGAEGYIPPPEQHRLGGYTTWPARTAGLVEDAEPRIVETLVGLLEKVSGGRRRRANTGADPPNSPYARAVAADRPKLYWRLSDWTVDARFSDGVAFYMPGRVGRAVHLAGGRIEALAAALAPLRENWSAEMWFWNGLPADARPVGGVLLRRGSDRLAIEGGRLTAAGMTGPSAIEPKIWNHVVLVRTGRRVTAYLNGVLEMNGEAALPAGDGRFCVGGCEQDRAVSFEGKVDEVAVYSRALRAGDVARHYRSIASAGR